MVCLSRLVGCLSILPLVVITAPLSSQPSQEHLSQLHSQSESIGEECEELGYFPTENPNRWVGLGIHSECIIPSNVTENKSSVLSHGARTPADKSPDPGLYVYDPSREVPESPQSEKSWAQVEGNLKSNIPRQSSLESLKDVENDEPLKSRGLDPALKEQYHSSPPDLDQYIGHPVSGIAPHSPCVIKGQWHKDCLENGYGEGDDIPSLGDGGPVSSIRHGGVIFSRQIAEPHPMVPVPVAVWPHTAVSPTATITHYPALSNTLFVSHTWTTFSAVAASPKPAAPNAKAIAALEAKLAADEVAVATADKELDEDKLAVAKAQLKEDQLTMAILKRTCSGKNLLPICSHPQASPPKEGLARKPQGGSEMRIDSTENRARDKIGPPDSDESEKHEQEKRDFFSHRVAEEHLDGEVRVPKSYGKRDSFGHRIAKESPNGEVRVPKSYEKRDANSGPRIDYEILSTRFVSGGGPIPGEENESPKKPEPPAASKKKNQIHPTLVDTATYEPPIYTAPPNAPDPPKSPIVPRGSVTPPADKKFNPMHPEDVVNDNIVSTNPDDPVSPPQEPPKLTPQQLAQVQEFLDCVRLDSLRFWNVPCTPETSQMKLKDEEDLEKELEKTLQVDKQKWQAHHDQLQDDDQSLAGDRERVEQTKELIKWYQAKVKEENEKGKNGTNPPEVKGAGGKSNGPGKEKKDMYNGHPIVQESEIGRPEIDATSERHEKRDVDIHGHRIVQEDAIGKPWFDNNNGNEKKRDVYNGHPIAQENSAGRPFVVAGNGPGPDKRDGDVDIHGHKIVQESESGRPWFEQGSGKEEKKEKRDFYGHRIVQESKERTPWVGKSWDA
ncbi:MAG: hypothetical protein MMC33_007916 [Icmadophila ericetorum]|nr:hypothetical protein [Icmadophila ericetorum]